jgi:hypothetical protein
MREKQASILGISKEEVNPQVEHEKKMSELSSDFQSGKVSPQEFAARHGELMNQRKATTTRTTQGKKDPDELSDTEKKIAAIDPEHKFDRPGPAREAERNIGRELEGRAAGRRYVSKEKEEPEAPVTPNRPMSIDEQKKKMREHVGELDKMLSNGKITPQQHADLRRQKFDELQGVSPTNDDIADIHAEATRTSDMQAGREMLGSRNDEGEGAKASASVSTDPHEAFLAQNPKYKSYLAMRDHLLGGIKHPDVKAYFERKLDEAERGDKGGNVDPTKLAAIHSFLHRGVAAAKNKDVAAASERTKASLSPEEKARYEQVKKEKEPQ